MTNTRRFSWLLLKDPETSFVDADAGGTTGRFEEYDPLCLAVLSTSPDYWEKSPGRCPSRAVAINTARLGIRIAFLTDNNNFPEISYLSFGTYFNVRGITISAKYPPLLPR